MLSWDQGLKPMVKNRRAIGPTYLRQPQGFKPLVKIDIQREPEARTIFRQGINSLEKGLVRRR